MEQTRSPAMHNAAFENLGLDYCYLPFPVHPERLGPAVEGLRALGIRGVNVTVPHKETVIPFLDDLSVEARFIGAVNTIVNADGKLTGYNTDGRGFMRSVSERGIDLSGKNVLVAGAGGAARAVSYYLSEKASGLSIYNRSKERLRGLVSDLSRIRRNVTGIERINDLTGFDIIINATSLGLKEDDPLPLDPDLLGKKQVVCDLIYKKTAFLIEAEKRGCQTIDGLDMLLYQGTLAFELWTGRTPPVEVMKKALYEGVSR